MSEAKVIVSSLSDSCDFTRAMLIRVHGAGIDVRCGSLCVGNRGNGDMDMDSTVNIGNVNILDHTYAEMNDVLGLDLSSSFHQREDAEARHEKPLDPLVRVCTAKKEQRGLQRRGVKGATALQQQPPEARLLGTVQQGARPGQYRDLHES